MKKPASLRLKWSIHTLESRPAWGGGPQADKAALAARELGELGDQRAVPALIEALKANNGTIQTQAAIALGRLADRRALAPLRALSRYGHHGPESAREMAIEAVVEIESATCGSPEALLADPDHRLRAAAVKKLAALGGPGTLEKLAAARRDMDAGVRFAVAAGLGQGQIPGAVPLLLELLGDESASVRARPCRM
jgi:HEAT repeat protein